MLVFSVRQDFNGCDCADPQRPLQELLDSFLCMKRRLSLSLENCVLNSMLDARFEMYISFFQDLITFERIFFSSIHMVVSAHSFEIISVAR